MKNKHTHCGFTHRFIMSTPLTASNFVPYTESICSAVTTGGYSPNIYDWTVEDGQNAPLTQRLTAQAEEKYKREGLKQAVEGLVMFISGNALRISCAQIDIIPEAFTPEEGLL